MCEFGCGSGIIALQLAQAFPNLRVFAVDSEPSAIKLAKENAQRMSLTNCVFDVVDVCKTLPSELYDTFDYIFIFDVLHDLHSVKKGIENARKLLKKGGYISAIEPTLNANLQENIGEAWAPYNFGIGLFHCVPTCLKDGAANEGALGPGWGWETTLNFVTEAGFKDVKIVEAVGFKSHMLVRK